MFRFDRLKQFGYTCEAMNEYNVNTSNHWFTTFNPEQTQHLEAKSTTDVKTLKINGDFAHLPNFNEEQFTMDAPKMKRLIVNGEKSKSRLQASRTNPPMMQIFEYLQLHDFGNRLPHFPEKLVNNMKNLRTIILKRNKLATMPSNIFKRNVYLEKFELSESETKFLPFNIFKNCRNLKQVKISETWLAEIPEGLFNNNPSLQSVVLDGNEFSTLPSELLIYAQNLTFFTANRNRIEYIPPHFFQKNLKIKNIRMNENLIKFLPPTLLWNLAELYDLSFPKNSITEIPEKFFDENPNLQIILLYGNLLTTLPEKLFEKNLLAQRIWIHDNRINHLPQKLLKNLTNLKDFAASGNAFGKLNDDFFSDNKKLVDRYL